MPFDRSPWPAPDGSPVGTTGWYLASDLRWYQTDVAPAPGLALAPDGRWRPADDVVEPWRSSQWGLGDCWWGLFAYIAAGMAGIVALTLAGTDLDDGGPVDPYLLGVLVGFNAIGAVTVVWLATRRKGLRSLRRDFGLTGRWRDVPIGIGLGLVGLITAGLLTSAVDALLDAEEGTSNLPVDDLTTVGQFATFFVAVAIVTPVIEELYFRGLLFRSLLKRGRRPVFTIIVSSLVFIVPHLPAAESWKEVAGLTAAIGVFGVTLGLSCHWTDNRLLAPIVAHLVINGASALALYFG